MFESSQWSLESALHAGLLAVVSVWVAWWALSLLLVLVHPRTAARIGPPLLRVLLVGGALTATVAPAHAERGAPTGTLDGLPMPVRPLTGNAGTAPAPPRPAPVSSAAVRVVEPGDSLWAIAREHSPTAPDATIATAVTRWHATNHDVIGPDPDLIQPGQRLVPPGAP